jgi:hypothetical protein
MLIMRRPVTPPLLFLQRVRIKYRKNFTAFICKTRSEMVGLLKGKRSVFGLRNVNILRWEGREVNLKRNEIMWDANISMHFCSI